MKINKLILVVVFATTLLTTVSCQNTKQKTNITMDRVITNKPDFDSLLASYKTMPVYYINYGNEDCLFELRVNDVIVDQMTHSGEIGGTAATINPYIMKSGKQKVSLKLYPFPDKSMIRSSGNQQYPYFKPFNLYIDYLDFKLPDNDQVSNVVYTMPDIVTPKEGIPYYEMEAEFEAQVPYTLSTYDEYRDLREIPDIEKRVVSEFNRVRQLMADKKFDELKDYLMQRDIYISLSMYDTNEDFENGWQKYIEKIEKGDPSDWQPIEDYRLEFNANGRSVTLRSLKKKGFPSALLWIKQEEGKSKYKGSYFDLNLGIRKGSDQFEAIIF